LEGENTIGSDDQVGAQHLAVGKSHGDIVLIAVKNVGSKGNPCTLCDSSIAKDLLVVCAVDEPVTVVIPSAFIHKP
jgi:hypothetical protein